MLDHFVIRFSTNMVTCLCRARMKIYWGWERLMGTPWKNAPRLSGSDLSRVRRGVYSKFSTTRILQRERGSLHFRGIDDDIDDIGVIFDNPSFWFCYISIYENFWELNMVTNPWTQLPTIRTLRAVRVWTDPIECRYGKNHESCEYSSAC